MSEIIWSFDQKLVMCINFIFKHLTFGQLIFGLLNFAPLYFHFLDFWLGLRRTGSSCHRALSHALVTVTAGDYITGTQT